MTSRIFRLEPQGLLDRTDARVMAHRGSLVRKVQPYGCPRNGTMGMCYVETVPDYDATFASEFVGLVCLSSLVNRQEATR